MLLITLFISFIMHTLPQDTITIISFDENRDSGHWQVINDGVMGGLSKGSFAVKAERAVFEGRVSLENNGGFSMVRHRFDKLSVIPYQHVVVHLKGDGKRYQLRLKSNVSQMHAYTCHFQTDGSWQEIRIPFTDFLPTFRGRKLEMPPFNGQVLEEIAILIGNKKAEEFRLVIKEVRLE